VICDDVITGLLNDMYISATGSPVCRITVGSCASRGSTFLTCWILDSTSETARSALASSRRFSVILLMFCCEEEMSVSMPSALATACSMGVVMNPLITSAFAPG
jgi:hypothetical protein